MQLSIAKLLLADRVEKVLVERTRSLHVMTPASVSAVSGAILAKPNPVQNLYDNNTRTIAILFGYFRPRRLFNRKWPGCKARPFKKYLPCPGNRN